MREFKNVDIGQGFKYQGAYFKKVNEFQAKNIYNRLIDFKPKDIVTTKYWLKYKHFFLECFFNILQQKIHHKILLSAYKSF